MIVKMKFLSISGPRTDIDRVCDVYLSKYEMQLENAVTELKTTEDVYKRQGKDRADARAHGAKAV